jgi:hypothetical protein
VEKTHQCRYGVVQYIHRDSIEEDIVMNPHRNAKKLKRAYYKTDPAVLDDIKQEAQHTKPKRLFKAQVFVTSIRYIVITNIKC